MSSDFFWELPFSPIAMVAGVIIILKNITLKNKWGTEWVKRKKMI